MKFFLFHEELQLFVVKFKYKEKNMRIQKISERSKNLCTNESQFVTTQRNHGNQWNQRNNEELFESVGIKE